MSRVIWLFLIGISLAGDSFAQSPTLAPSPTPSASPSPSGTPTESEMINSLTQADLQETISLLKKNFANPQAISETQIDRATIQGLIARLGPGMMLLPDKASANVEPPAPFYSEIFEKHIGYIRPGTLNPANLDALDKKMADFSSRKVDALIVDLRASRGSEFQTAADFAK